MPSNPRNTEISIHLLTWLVLFTLPAALSVGSGINWMQLIQHFYLQLIFINIIFYINYFWLSEWLYSKKKLQFFLANAALIIVLILLKDVLFSLFEDGTPRNNRSSRPPEMMRYFIDSMMYMIPVAFSLAIISAKKISQTEKLRDEADHIRLQSEMMHLKYQLQPHFFFNALNNIYSLIDFAAQTAKKSIHSLSKLMRYMLYKSEGETIRLEDEIEFLNQYIELMKLRLTDKTTVKTDFPKKVPDLSIPPLLFISIVENAFKHGVSALEPSEINFKMDLSHGDEIRFLASNNNFPKADSDRSGSGIGIENLKKRLNLMYPGQHCFISEINGDIYTTEVILHTGKDSE